MEIEKYNWIYRVDKNSIEIIPDKKSKKPIPESLYKYYSLNENSVNALINSYIYAPHPIQLNDPLDCYYRLMTVENLDSIVQLMKGSMDPDEIREEWNKNRLGFIQNVLYNYANRAFMDLGIFSLTADPTNILMWSYYSNHSGFVVQYDFEAMKSNHLPSEIILGPFQINYQSEIQTIPFDTDNISLIFLYLTNIKSEKWKHENEWRMIFGREKMKTPGIEVPENFKNHLTNDRRFKFETKEIRKIILGKNFFAQNEFLMNDNDVFIRFQNPEENKNTNNKRKVLEYIIQYNIPCELVGIDSDSFSLKTLTVRFQKTKIENQYLMF